MSRRLALAAVAAAAALTAPVAASAAPGAPGPNPDRNAMGYYVALGDSLAAGYQPGAGDDKQGGYAGDVLDAVQVTQPKTRLVNLSCSGETTVTMLDGTHCDYSAGSQVDQAVRFLKAHAKNTRLVTIDIGANDVQTCVKGTAVDYNCIFAGLATVNKNLPDILGRLRAAAPDVKIVALNYYNPFLASHLAGPEGQALAQQSTMLQSILNGSIASAAAAVGAPVADVATAFESDNWTPTTLPGLGTVPTNVARICSWTWMCTKSDIHANDAGYAVLAQAVVVRL
ncbi:MAG: SGNH/GDSL hydrolase family protein [Micrococcales bacterium]|nr:SGNH/GDSL hydrolase family protein [Micrococcales bacterium]